MCELSACACLPGAQSRLAWSKDGARNGGVANGVVAPTTVCVGRARSEPLSKAMLFVSFFVLCTTEQRKNEAPRQEKERMPSLTLPLLCASASLFVFSFFYLPSAAPSPPPRPLNQSLLLVLFIYHSSSLPPSFPKL